MINTVLLWRPTGYRTTAEEKGSAYAWTGSKWEDVKGADWMHPTIGTESHIPDKADHPVVTVSWHDAQAFCKWAGVLLPTEAEWEKAARGTDGRMWPWGNDKPTKDHCNFNGNVGDTTPAGSYPKGVSPYGCLDMAGNVWEWTSSLRRPYPYDGKDGRRISNREKIVCCVGGRSSTTSTSFAAPSGTGSARTSGTRALRVPSCVPRLLAFDLWNL